MFQHHPSTPQHHPHPQHFPQHPHPHPYNLYHQYQQHPQQQISHPPHLPPLHGNSNNNNNSNSHALIKQEEQHKIKQEERDQHPTDQDDYDDHDHDHDFTGSDGASSSSNSMHDDINSSPTQPGSSATKPKGKMFQCTGFGDCRMVFTRSEHLARHARKHTGEKPFKCVVNGCSRMFSRFDNMVQHTQTHIKGAHPNFSEDLAQKIAVETRRKSEIGSLGMGMISSTPSRSTSKSSKRGSIHGAPVKETATSSARRVQSVPMLAVGNLPIVSATSAPYSRTSHSPTLGSSVSPSSPVSHDPQEKRVKRSTSKKSIKRERTQGQGHHRTGSLEALTQKPHIESWYASKLRHRPSLDYGLDMYAQRSATTSNGGLDAHLPPLNHYHYHQAPTHALHPLDQPSFVSAPHPLSFEGSVPLESSSGSLEDCTLPPLRSILSPPEPQIRLPSIVNGRYRSHSIHFDSHAPTPAMASRTRRLSLVDLDAPIQEATQAVHHSIAASAPIKAESGVDVSEDEIQALEAFGELWSRGRGQKQPQGRVVTARTLGPDNVRESPQATMPGLDHGRRPIAPHDDTVQKACKEMSMDLD
ncbi:hypothetical protein BG004_002616 [Podila humilis]|nr:hypothetical protein BG004_002616 [Podila humilis]